MTIESRLAEIRARAEAATEGPWEDVVDDLNEDVDVWHDREYRLWIANTGNLFTASAKLARQTLADAEFIAHSRTDLPALLAAIMDALDVENERMPSGSEGDDWYRVGWQDAMFTVKSRITDALEVQG